MTNQRWIKSLELVDILTTMNMNIENPDCKCIIDVITGAYVDCPPTPDCRTCIKNWLKAEKEDNS